MPILRDVRSLFRRKQQPIEIDLTDPQAERLSDVVRDAEQNGRHDEDALVRDQDTDADALLPGADVGAGPGVGAEEVMNLTRRITQSLDEHAAHSQRVIQLMDRLPQAIEAVPEINRQIARLLEALHDHFDQSATRDEALNGTLTRMNESSEHMAQLLGVLQQHLELNSTNTDRLTDVLGTVQVTLGSLADSNAQSISAMQESARATGRRKTEITRTLDQTRRWIITAVICCAGTSVVAMVIALLTLLR